MLTYILICLCLSLLGIAGLQFFYLIYLDRIGKEHKKRIRELELDARNLAKLLEETPEHTEQQNQRHSSASNAAN